jgi:hypothetical protein
LRKPSGGLLREIKKSFRREMTPAAVCQSVSLRLGMVEVKTNVQELSSLYHYQWHLSRRARLESSPPERKYLGTPDPNG